MITYKLVNDRNGKPMCVNRSDGWSIPFSPDNTDYQVFLKYQAEGGKVYGADEEIPDGQAAE
jgi:hypothetical protein